ATLRQCSGPPIRTLYGIPHSMGQAPQRRLRARGRPATRAAGRLHVRVGRDYHLAPATTTNSGGSTMDRRSFMASAAGATLATGSALAEEGAMTKRFAEQRWALDNIIRANGIDWDQPRSLYLSAPCGVEANADFAAIRARVQKMADIGPAFESTAKRREAKARSAEGSNVTARDNWYMAGVTPKRVGIPK